jgi:thioredoxin 1
MPVMVDYWGEGCEHCLELMPGVEELAEQYGDKMKFAKLNIKGNRRLAMSQQVMGLPSMVFYVDGEKVAHLSGDDLTLEEIEENVKMENPRDAKMRLAFEIVRIFHGEEKASEAQEDFVSTIQKKGIPDNVEEVEISEGESVLDFMIKSGLAESKSDARRKIEQGGVSVNGKSINASTLILNKKEHDGKIIKVGKRNFRKIVF